MSCKCNKPTSYDEARDVIEQVQNGGQVSICELVAAIEHIGSASPKEDVPPTNQNPKYTVHNHDGELCGHRHRTLNGASKCADQHGLGWGVYEDEKYCYTTNRRGLLSNGN